jgi:hypothetical protein
LSKTKTIKVSDIHAKDYASDPAYRKAYDDLEEEYALISTLIEARTRANLSQAQTAEHDADRNRAAGERQYHALDAHAQEDRQGDRA